MTWIIIYYVKRHGKTLVLFAFENINKVVLITHSTEVTQYRIKTIFNYSWRKLLRTNRVGGGGVVIAKTCNLKSQDNPDQGSCMDHLSGRLEFKSVSWLANKKYTLQHLIEQLLNHCLTMHTLTTNIISEYNKVSKYIEVAWQRIIKSILNFVT